MYATLSDIGDRHHHDGGKGTHEGKEEASAEFFPAKGLGGRHNRQEMNKV